MSITLLDSLNKRVNFLNLVIDKLSLENITAIHGRAEDIARNSSYREQYDVCLSRAVANLSTLSEYCIPFVKKDGFFISYKAGDCEKEISDAGHAIGILGGKTEKIVDYTLPDSDIERKFVLIRKVKPTSNKYPRKSGTPAKEPLK